MDPGPGHPRAEYPPQAVGYRLTASADSGRQLKVRRPSATNETVTATKTEGPFLFLEARTPEKQP